MTTNLPVIHLLWTGGWDSTFRLLDLTITQNRIVQPHYIVNCTRPSLTLELRTQAALRKMLYASFPQTQSLVLPTHLYNSAEFPEDAILQAQFLALQSKYRIGSQYAWIANFARNCADSPLELSLTYEGKIRNLLAPCIMPIDYAGLTTYQLNDSPYDTDLELFRDFTFPLFQIKKTDMTEVARSGGFLDILNATWFCFTPIRNRIPCGRCTACRPLMEHGYTERMHWLSHVQYWLYRHTRWIPDLRTELRKYPALHRTLRRLLRPDPFEYQRPT